MERPDPASRPLRVCVCRGRGEEGVAMQALGVWGCKSFPSEARALLGHQMSACLSIAPEVIVPFFQQ